MDSPFNWTLLHVIGRGGSSTVYKAATNSSSGLPPYVAVKQIDTESLNALQIRGIQSEIATMRHLSHSHIVQYFRADEGPNRIYMVMEYAAYGSLRQFYQRHGPLTEGEATYCLQQVLQGLRYLHSQGFAHRDVKCANCLLFEEGRVKLADFGASKKYENESIVSGLKGTPNWMAPEVEASSM
jgi:mitogen-activated protein kinase kinase kinase ANP1